MSRESLIKKWTEENRPIGEALGYPDCCIREFCNQPPQLLKGNPTKDDKRRHKASYVNGVYTGFIPCAEHAKQIVQGKITLESLIDKEKRANNDEYYIPEFPNAMQWHFC